MKLEIAQLDELHAFLTETSERYGSGSGFVTESSEPHPIFPGTSLRGNFLNLPNPLKGVKFDLFCREGFYEAMVVLAGKEEDSFKGVSDEFGKRFSDDWLRWLPVSSDGVGYILDERRSKQIPFVAISKVSSSPTERFDVRIIVLGSHGAEPRRVEKDEEAFSQQMSDLQIMANSYLSAVYSLHSSEYSQNLDKITLPLECIL